MSYWLVRITVVITLWSSAWMMTASASPVSGGTAHLAAASNGHSLNPPAGWYPNGSATNGTDVFVAYVRRLDKQDHYESVIYRKPGLNGNFTIPACPAGGMKNVCSPVIAGKVNGMTYNPKTRQLVAAILNGSVPGSSTTTPNPDNLLFYSTQLTPSKAPNQASIPVGASAVCFDASYPQNGRYVVGGFGSGFHAYTLHSTNGAISATALPNQIIQKSWLSDLRRSWTDAGTVLPQAIACNPTYVFVVVDKRAGSSFQARIYAYKWSDIERGVNAPMYYTVTKHDGSALGSMELESLFIAGNKLYATFNANPDAYYTVSGIPLADY